MPKEIRVRIPLLPPSSNPLLSLSFLSRQFSLYAIFTVVAGMQLVTVNFSSHWSRCLSLLVSFFFFFGVVGGDLYSPRTPPSLSFTSLKRDIFRPPYTLPARLSASSAKKRYLQPPSPPPNSPPPPPPPKVILMPTRTTVPRCPTTPRFYSPSSPPRWIVEFLEDAHRMQVGRFNPFSANSPYFKVFPSPVPFSLILSPRRCPCFFSHSFLPAVTTSQFTLPFLRSALSPLKEVGPSEVPVSTLAVTAPAPLCGDFR